MNKKKLQLLPHNPLWKEDFAAEKERILVAANEANVRVEHVGSTSIPNVHAKPILDIAILCGKEGIEPVINALESLGYEYRGRFDDEDGHFYAVLDKGDVRFCQVHIYPQPNADWHSKLKFRDILTKNAELAREYNDYKLQLAATVTNKSEYAAIKDKWVDEFILKLDIESV